MNSFFSEFVNCRNEKGKIMDMKVLVLASQKGGPGKTTLAAHLAVAAESAGMGPVVLIDTDPQASLADWWNERQAETPAFASMTVADLAGNLEQLAAAGFKLAVIDTPPAMTSSISSVVAVADMVLVPVRPSPHDLRAVGQTVELVEQAGKPFAFVLTQAKGIARLTAQAAAALSEHGVLLGTIIGDRVDYASSMIDGRTVNELAPKGASAGEITALWEKVAERLTGGKRRKAKA
jgi:chromosome partitioning protein